VTGQSPSAYLMQRYRIGRRSVQINPSCNPLIGFKVDLCYYCQRTVGEEAPVPHDHPDSMICEFSMPMSRWAWWKSGKWDRPPWKYSTP